MQRPGGQRERGRSHLTASDWLGVARGFWLGPWPLTPLTETGNPGEGASLRWEMASLRGRVGCVLELACTAS